MTDNPYLPPIQHVLPRLLSLFDADRTSASYGFGDRYYWAWGLIDFGNGTFQGAAHGMARLWSAGLWPYATDTEVFLARIDAMFRATRELTRKDGSLEEAFPNEGSFCVTALVAFDLICALDLLRTEISEPRKTAWQAIVEPLMAYLLDADETHALISNHLATATAALVRWHRLTGDPASEVRAKTLLNRILEHQSSEGWYEEYGGADPGYQSLCTYYLADVHQHRPDWNLGGSLTRSLAFLRYFIHPDGSFGGLYGSRNTRFYYPAGFEALAEEISEAGLIAGFMADAIASQKVVTLTCMDEPNLIPTFNAYCWAAAIKATSVPRKPNSKLPALSSHTERTHFPAAGLIVDAGPNHYTIISTHKGGVVLHFVDGDNNLSDAGIVVRDPKGRLGSSQSFNTQNAVQLDGESVTVLSTITEMPRKLPSPIEFIALRLLSVSLFRLRTPREWIKRMLVRLLITRKEEWPVQNTREVVFGPDLQIMDETAAAPGYDILESPGDFVAIHMASQGYWQIQDERN